MNKQSILRRIQADGLFTVLRNGPASYLPRPLRIIIDLLAILVLPYLGFTLVELLFQRAPLLKPQIIVLNYLLYLALLLTCIGLTGRLKRGARLFILFLWAAATLNYAVIAFRSTPIVPWDIYSVGTAATVVGNYSFPFTGLYLMVTLCFLLLFVGAWLLSWRAKSRLRHLAACVSGIILLTSSILYVARPETKQAFGLDDTLFNTNYMSRHNGFLVNFTHSLRYLNVEAPADYSLDRVQDLYEDQLARLERETSSDGHRDARLSLIPPQNHVPDPDPSADRDYDLPTNDPVDQAHIEEIRSYLDLVNYHVPRELQPGETPDIIVVMNEAFSDMRALQPYETNTPVLPFYKNLYANTYKGVTHPSVVGGNTATSEFEFLSGSSMAFLPPGAIAYQQYIQGPTPTLVSTLQEQGYEAIAMHPYHAGGWKRNTVYPHFGFERIKFLNDFSNRDRLRDYISDAALYDEIIDELDRPNPASDPRFVFTISMQNHGGYTKAFDNFDPQIEITDRKSSLALNNYLSLVRESDRALGEFMAELSQRESPTLVLFFGDHQPNDFTARTLTSGLTSEEATERRRETPFFLWANYQLPGEPVDGLKTSLNFLPTHLLEAAQLELTPWHAFLREVSATIPAMNDAFYYLQDGEARAYDEADLLPILQDYQILQYNYLFDVDNRLEELFCPPE